MAHLRWAVIALQQAQRHTAGGERSLELALTGRIVHELEYEAAAADRQEAAHERHFRRGRPDRNGARSVAARTGARAVRRAPLSRIDDRQRNGHCGAGAPARGRCDAQRSRAAWKTARRRRAMPSTAAKRRRHGSNCRRCAERSAVAIRAGDFDAPEHADALAAALDRTTRDWVAISNPKALRSDSATPPSADSEPIARRRWNSTLTGRNALVTGANGGLGSHFAQTLAKAGANVAIAARRVESLRPVHDAIGELGVRVASRRARRHRSGERRSRVRRGSRSARTDHRRRSTMQASRSPSRFSSTPRRIGSR